MKQKNNSIFINNEKQRFSLRKLSIGVCSVLLGITLFSANNQITKADTVSEYQNVQNDSASANSNEINNSNQDTSKDDVQNTSIKEKTTQAPTLVSDTKQEEINTSSLSDKSETKANDLKVNTPAQQKVTIDTKKNEQNTNNSKTPLTTSKVVKDMQKVDQEQPERVSVHDPSIFQDPKTGKYYIFGSHQAEAESDDLYNWKPLFKKEYEQPSYIFNNYDKDLVPIFKWAGSNDGDAKNGYAIWAPDEIYNPDYTWKDGHKGAYMYYFAASSSWIHSAIGFAVSDTVHGPYKFVNTVVYSGFTKDREHNGDSSSKNDIYTNTNLKDLINNGTIDGFSNKWIRPDGTYNNDYAPNAIDVNIITDKNKNLWMSYGSWSGGIFLLPLNKETGMPIYPGKDSINQYGQNVDRYFGTHLIGGFHESGEAPYIKYDPKTDYYYLFVTYGGLTREGGYNMRLFRSKEIDGKYVDAMGQHPEYTSWKTNDAFLQENQKYGIKLEGNYDFSCLPYSYMSPGHNSAFIDKNGNWFLINHTRFDDGTEYHEIRVKQMIMTQNGWPIPLPFEYTGKEQAITSSNLSTVTKQIVGNYEFVNNGTKTSGKPIPRANISLNDNHQVTGDLEGTWKTSVENNHIYLTITSKDGATFTGEFNLQQDESTDHKPSLVFAALGNNNEVIWGVKPYQVKDDSKDNNNENHNTPSTNPDNPSTDNPVDNQFNSNPITSNNAISSNSSTENTSNSNSTSPLAQNPSKGLNHVILTHNAYVYNSNLQILRKGNKKLMLPAGRTLSVLDNGKKHKIQGKEFYRIGQNKYVKVSNTVSYYRLNRNSFAYNRKGLAHQKNGHKIVLKKNRRVKVIKTVKIHEQKYYQIGSNTFVKARNVTKVVAYK